MKSFDERLERYKKETDYFLVDIWKSKDYVYETKHDLTWNQARAILNRAKKNEKIARVDILVEDWDQEDDYLFKEVESLIKVPFKWSMSEYLNGESGLFDNPIGWKYEEKGE